MNNEHLKVLECIIKNSNITQRQISLKTGFSLGKVNNVIAFLQQSDYIDKNKNISKKTKVLINESKPRNAIILAAGYGFSTAPINQHTNKALIEVKGDILIERLISQLNEANIYDITIIVGYLKEKFEYLIDKYNVKLNINMAYATSNSLHSLACAKDSINNTYIIPCDLYFEYNPFSTYELFSWYMITDKIDNTSFLKYISGKLHYVKDSGNQLVGVSYIDSKDSDMLVDKINFFISKGKHNIFWEEILVDNKKCIIDCNIIDSDIIKEFNTSSDFQQFDVLAPDLKTEIIETVQNALNVSRNLITDITSLKTGMTNRSFLIECDNTKYIMRIPGEGCKMLIDRKGEKAVYEKIKNLHISDTVLFFDDKKGYKLTKFIENVHSCDAKNYEETKKCMLFLKDLHSRKLSVDHQFDIYERIEYYQSLWSGKDSVYKDYYETKKQLYELKNFIDKQDKIYALAHIDAVPDNFLFFNENATEQIRLIDWEYSSMQDPHIDIAMFAIYSLYKKNQVDQLIDFYFENKCDKNTRIKIYCYIACCGLLWSNWCEYKSSLGVEFGEYAINQYRYAKEYFKIVKNELNGEFK